LSLRSVLQRIAREHGADLFGVADLRSARDFICRQGGEQLGKFPRGISVGIWLLDAIVDELYRHEDRLTLFAYRGLYNSLNSRLDHIVLLLAKRIQEEGYSSYAIPASPPYDLDRLIGVLSHKLVANLAGLGWIGKSCLLITLSHGPRVRFSTLLTDAPLETSSPVERGCGDCRACIEVCPVNAFTGAAFSPLEPVEARFNVHLCNDYMSKRKERLGEELCGLCVYVCPHGRARKVETA
jgi:epoxyqueuosine reductase QueG